jgi:hypothetical protein
MVVSLLAGSHPHVYDVRVYDERSMRMLHSHMPVCGGQLSDRTIGATVTWTPLSGLWRRWPSRPSSSASWR